MLQHHKRQIFREQVSPHTGGKIPEDAFRADRLALNKLNSAGFSVPDGVQLHWRGSHTPDTQHHSAEGHSHSHDPHSSLIKIVQTADGRYVPPEGTVHQQQQNTVSHGLLAAGVAGFEHHHPRVIFFLSLVEKPITYTGCIVSFPCPFPMP